MESEEPLRVPLLGHLAGEGWFMRRGEVAATQALTWLTSDPALRSSLLAFLGERAGIDLSRVDRFAAEVVHDDLSRPDIEGLDADGRAVMLVEAKFNAHLAVAQVGAYLDILESPRAASDGALFVLVPPSRAGEAQAIIDAATEARNGSAPKAAVITWDEWIAVWESTATRIGDKALLADLTQLRAMCQTLGGLVVAPLAGAVRGRDWEQRADDLVAIVKTVTERFLGSTKFPMQGNLINKPHAYRYLPKLPAGGWLQVGVYGRFADEGLTPFWVMLHKDDDHSGGFERAHRRIMSSHLSRRVRRDEGHVWIPLDAPATATGPEVADALTTQIGEILQIVGS